MTDRRRSAPPRELPHDAAPDLRQANEVIRAVFGAMIDEGITQADFADRIGLSERSIEKWRAPAAFAEGARGPGIVHVVRALHALGLELDVRPKGGRKAIPLAVRNGLAEIERDRRRRNETSAEHTARFDRLREDARRKGYLRSDEPDDGCPPDTTDNPT